MSRGRSARGDRKRVRKGAHASVDPTLPAPMQPYPYRWNIAKRSELGSVISISDSELADWVDEQFFWSYRSWMVRLRGTRCVDWLASQLLKTSARILAISDGSDLFFVGRSAESYFDLLRGIFANKPTGARLRLLPFSVRSPDVFGQAIAKPQLARMLRRHLAGLSLSPIAIIRRDRPVALIDIVASGSTLGNLITFLRHWCEAEGQPWKQLRAKLRIVGLTERTKTSPKTWRWQQHADWTGQLPKSAIRNVSIPLPLFHYLGGGQAKLSTPYDPEHWNDETINRPLRGSDSRMAARFALALFEGGRLSSWRKALARRMADQSAVRYSWFRDLMREVIAP